MDENPFVVDQLIDLPSRRVYERTLRFLERRAILDFTIDAISVRARFIGPIRQPFKLSRPEPEIRKPTTLTVYYLNLNPFRVIQ